MYDVALVKCWQRVHGGRMHRCVERPCPRECLGRLAQCVQVVGTRLDIAEILDGINRIGTALRTHGSQKGQYDEESSEPAEEG